MNIRQRICAHFKISDADYDLLRHEPDTFEWMIEATEGAERAQQTIEDLQRIAATLERLR